MGVSREVVGKIVNNSRGISEMEASELAGLFETDKDFRINIQALHERLEGRQIIASRHYQPITIFLCSAAS